jgi:hypothetical protein
MSDWTKAFPCPSDSVHQQWTEPSVTLDGPHSYRAYLDEKGLSVDIYHFSQKPVFPY